ncbi:MAG TPA: hypothetical protein VM489_18450, partial [Burkholderiales bacterium]|nr:hypothetical protein [Burkholderiales bacterium]
MASTALLRAALLAGAALAFAPPAIADKGKGRDDKPYSRFEEKKNRYTYEYRDERCRYKYEHHYKSGKTKIDQRGDCSALGFARPVAHGREPLPRAVPPEPQARVIECNREVLGAVLGDAAGALIGARIGQ